jgi:hypothetical protein
MQLICKRENNNKKNYKYRLIHDQLFFEKVGKIDHFAPYSIKNVHQVESIDLSYYELKKRFNTVFLKGASSVSSLSDFATDLKAHLVTELSSFLSCALSMNESVSAFLTSSDIVRFSPFTESILKSSAVLVFEL